MQKKLFKFVGSVSPQVKKYLVATNDFFCLVLIYYFSSISFDFLGDFVDFKSALIFGISNIAISLFLRNYQIVWGLFGVRDVFSIGISILLSVLLVAIATGFSGRIYFYILLGLMSFYSIIILRIIYAKWRDLFGFNGERTKIVILGAGAAGAQIYEQLKSSPSLKIDPIGFLDDSLDSQRRTVCGAPVLGTISEIGEVKEKFGVSKGIIAIPSATPSQINAMHSFALGARVELRTLPSLSQILHGKVSPHQIKDIEPEDLLGRDPVNLNEGSIREIIFDKVILITGAGGSIGSELCFQIAKFSPKKLILFEQTELFLYEIDMKLRSLFPQISIIAMVGDVRDIATVELAISVSTPSVIFHAAAYKHVPLMEDNPGEAVVTNLIGTNNVASIAAKYSVPRFVLISTDKAVNPTNIMGATKRAAEIACKILSEDYPATKFMVVRFGNVLGSSGSVIPLFKKQISNGGPVTVTHKDIVRYFMSVPEACQLVMYAGAIGCGGELYVLDMGEPVKIVDLAQDMIRLSGFKPGIDIKIEYTGLRKGEKMYEELLSDKENTLETMHPKIRVANCIKADEVIRYKMSTLLCLSKNTDASIVAEALKDLMPEFISKQWS
jgi:FlaA1/EpsC-like NDP-sugar epimerase